MLNEEIAHARNGEEAYAGFKLNSLTDKKIIDKLKTKLQEMFDVMLSDNQKARKLEADGNYHRVSNDLTAVNAQEYFYAEAYHKIS